MAILDLLCIGAQKAGTTWLYGMLSQHPGVFRAPIKEVHYFDSLHVPENKQWTKKAARRSLRKQIRKCRKKAETANEDEIAWLESLAEGKRIYTPEWYEELFAGPGSEGKIKFEKTPAYSTLPLEAIKDVRSTLGDIPIVYIIRDPLDRMLSQIRWLALRRFKDEAIGESDWNELYAGMRERGDYKTYIPRWLSVFPEESMHFIPFKRIPTDPENLMRDIEGLVGLPPHEYNNRRAQRRSTKKIELPQSLIDLATEHVAPQYTFLEQHFGKEFVEMI